METIRIYLENMFSRLPRTPEIIKLENDMLRTMEDKYEELKMEGKSENEATPNGKRRTYYRITETGRRYYAEKCEEWKVTKEVVEQFIRL